MADPSTDTSYFPHDQSSQPSHATDLSSSGITIPSDSENYSSATNNHDLSSSPSPPPSSEESPIIIYKPPTIWSLLRGAAINLLLPFVNGLMLGFGELLAHEAAFRLGWGGTKVFPSHRASHPIGPGIEVREDPFERRRRNDSDIIDAAALE